MTETQTAERLVQVGDFFEESWGYEQTNVDFFQVMRISPSGKTVWLQHVRSEIVRGAGAPQEYVVPVTDAFDRPEKEWKGSRDGVLKRTLRRSRDGEWNVNMTSYSNAYLWDGKPQYQTGAMYGH